MTIRRGIKRCRGIKKCIRTIQARDQTWFKKSRGNVEVDSLGELLPDQNLIETGRKPGRLIFVRLFR